jgi:hypothetical protein
MQNLHYSYVLKNNNMSTEKFKLRESVSSFNLLNEPVNGSSYRSCTNQTAVGRVTNNKEEILWGKATVAYPDIVFRDFYSRNEENHDKSQSD